MNHLDHLSCSQANTWSACHKKWKYRYIDGLIIPPSGAMAQGTGVHKAQEVNFEQKIESKEDLPEDDVVDAFSDSWESQADKIDFGGDKPGELKDQGVELTKLYHAEIAPRIEPVAVEQKFKIEFEDTNWSVIGYIDVRGTGKTHDTKTTGKSPSQIQGYDFQSATYWIGEKYGLGVEPQPFEYNCLVKNKKPKSVNIEVPDQSQWEQYTLQKYADIAIEIHSALKTGVFAPNEGHFLCSPRWCGYHSKCFS